MGRLSTFALRLVLDEGFLDEGVERLELLDRDDMSKRDYK
jgi:hypothetical protein